jgi:Nif-specific regulatory protein
MNTTHWLRAADCPLLQSDPAADGPSSPRLLLRLLDLCLSRPFTEDLADALVAEIGTTLRADQAAVLASISPWPILCQYQRKTCREQPLNLPRAWLDEVKDRRAGSSRPPGPTAPAFLAATVPTRDQGGRLLLAARGRDAFNTGELEYAVAAGHYLGQALERIREWETARRCNAAYADQVQPGCHIIGESPAIRTLRDTLERVAPTELPVLILGESGTGKEVVARALHHASLGPSGPFVVVHCAGAAEDRLEDELFGGDADVGHSCRPSGLFEAASGGTLVLDEVGALGPVTQARLLLELEQQLAEGTGGHSTTPRACRLVATNRHPLSEAVRAGRFRLDLYYRLSPVKIELSPLCRRPEDIVLLANCFLHQFGKETGRPDLHLSAAAAQRLTQHDWPGNIRELRNLLERVVYLCSRDRIEVEDLPFVLPARTDREGDFSQLTLAQATEAFQASHIRKVIARTGGNMSDAAKLLGLHRPNLYRKMRLLKMELEGK